MDISSKSVTDLLTDAPAGRHFAQLHKDSNSLAQAVALFVEAGLRRGDAVILIASRSRIALYLRQVRAAGLDPDPFRLSRQLTVVDADALRGRLIRKTAPSWEEFRAAMIPVIESAASSGRRVMRIYGETVNDLWRAGNTTAAISLEEFWNELARSYRFCLFCGYELDGFDDKSYSGPIDEIGRTHCAILETHDDTCLQTAVDVASNELLGSSLSDLVSQSATGESRLPAGRRTLLWLKRNMPNTMADILRRARHYSQHEN